MSERILVIAAHPDDEVLGCGGVIARHVSDGAEVAVLVVTRGAPELFDDKYVEQVRCEMRNANQVLGVSRFQFLDFPAPKLDTIPQHLLADALGTIIRSFEPITVYIPHWGDLHGDHRAVCSASLVAARPIEECSVKRILCYETLSETEWGSPSGDQAFMPTIFVDTTDYLERKIEAMKCYHSQLKKPPHPRSLEAIAAQARVRGSTVGLTAAESFVLVREIIA